jgi:hypothetical protein
MAMHHYLSHRCFALLICHAGQSVDVVGADHGHPFPDVAIHVQLRMFLPPPFYTIIPGFSLYLLNMIASMALGLVFLSNPAFPLKTKNKLEQLIPAGFALISTFLVLFFLWLFALTSFTFILIRDKRTIFRFV